MDITVVYHATAPVETELELDGAALELPQAGIQKRHVRMNANDIDFRVSSK